MEAMSLEQSRSIENGLNGFFLQDLLLGLFSPSVETKGWNRQIR